MFLQKYKWGQAKNTRLWVAVGIEVIVAVGCYRLYLRLSDMSGSYALVQWVRAVVPLAVFAAATLLVYIFFNKPSFSDFIIASEGELKKVSFASRREIIISTAVVIITVISLACMLGFMDFVFNLFFMNVLGI